MKFKTAKQAWVFLQKQFALYGKENILTTYNDCGICKAITHLYTDGLISIKIKSLMSNQLKRNRKHSEIPNGIFWFSQTFTSDGAAKRAKFIKKYLIKA